MEDNKVLADRFIVWFSSRYEHLRNKYRKFCEEKDYEWDIDVFSDTYVKMYEKILRDGLKDTSEKGMEAYLFMSFRNNIKREKMYKRNSARDLNVPEEEISDLYEQYSNEHKNTEGEKVRSDLWKDFASVYLVQKAEQHFDEDTMRLFKVKTFSRNMTYKKLQKKFPEQKKVRDRVVEVKNWLKDNVSKEEVINEFYKKYDELL